MFKILVVFTHGFLADLIFVINLFYSADHLFFFIGKQIAFAFSHVDIETNRNLLSEKFEEKVSSAVSLMIECSGHVAELVGRHHLGGARK